MNEVTVLPKPVVNRERRDEVEERIDRGFKRCIEDLAMIGGGFADMLNEGLYLDDYATFAEYVEAVWDITEQTARRWITAYRVANNVASAPQNRQLEFGKAIEGMTIAAAYALSQNARHEEQGEVWSKAKTISETPSAQLIKKVAERYSMLVQRADGMTMEEEVRELQAAEGEMDAIDIGELSETWAKSLVRKWKGMREKYQPSFGEQNPKIARAVAKIEEGISELVPNAAE